MVNTTETQVNKDRDEVKSILISKSEKSIEYTKLEEKYKMQNLNIEELESKVVTENPVKLRANLKTVEKQVEELQNQKARRVPPSAKQNFKKTVKECCSQLGDRIKIMKEIRELQKSSNIIVKKLQTLTSSLNNFQTEHETLVEQKRELTKRLEKL
eukprot:UN25689